MSPQIDLDHKELETREAAMLAKTPYQLFTEAADIIENDPMLTPSAYTEPRWVNKATGALFSRGFLANVDIDETLYEAKPCHCLEGAIQEAAGVYTTSPEFPGWLVVVTGMDKAYNRIWERKLNAILCRQFDINKFHAVQEYLSCPSIEAALEIYSANDLVYVYSDKVLSPMLKAGAEEAARLLRAAAETVKEA